MQWSISSISLYLNLAAKLLSVEMKYELNWSAVSLSLEVKPVWVWTGETNALFWGINFLIVFHNFLELLTLLQIFLIDAITMSGQGVFKGGPEIKKKKLYDTFHHK